jgi:hypothetical protein
MRRLIAVIAFSCAVAHPSTAAAQAALRATPASLARRADPSVARAPQESGAATERPVQVALFFPVQIFPETDPVEGVRINLLYGKSADVTGLDLGLVNQTTHSFLGVQFGLVGVAQGAFTGGQVNWLANVSQGTFKGIQWAAVVNSVDQGRGGQIFGGVNVAQQFRGLQIGLVNYAQSLDGVQIGLSNIIKSGGQFPVMVLVNWGKGTFEESDGG